VRVKVQRDRHGRVAEPLLDDLITPVVVAAGQTCHVGFSHDNTTVELNTGYGGTWTLGYNRPVPGAIHIARPRYQRVRQLLRVCRGPRRLGQALRRLGQGPGRERPPGGRQCAGGRGMGQGAAAHGSGAGCVSLRHPPGDRATPDRPERRIVRSGRSRAGAQAAPHRPWVASRVLPTSPDPGSAAPNVCATWPSSGLTKRTRCG
jgi:hypothetical protein